MHTCTDADICLEEIIQLCAKSNHVKVRPQNLKCASPFFGGSQYMHHKRPVFINVREVTSEEVFLARTWEIAKTVLHNNWTIKYDLPTNPRWTWSQHVGKHTEYWMDPDALTLQSSFLPKGLRQSHNGMSKTWKKSCNLVTYGSNNIGKVVWSRTRIPRNLS